MSLDLGLRLGRGLLIGGGLLGSWLGTVLLLIGGVGHLAQLVLLLELAGDDTPVGDQVAAGNDDGFTGADLSVGLDPQKELGLERVRHLKNQC